MYVDHQALRLLIERLPLAFVPGGTTPTVTGLPNGQETPQKPDLPAVSSAAHRQRVHLTNSADFLMLASYRACTSPVVLPAASMGNRTQLHEAIPNLERFTPAKTTQASCPLALSRVKPVYIAVKVQWLMRNLGISQQGREPSTDRPPTTLYTSSRACVPHLKRKLMCTVMQWLE
jgi:hypothetical protein